MAASRGSGEQASRSAPASSAPSSPLEHPADRQLIRWGGVAGLGGVALLVCSAVVVGAFGLPDASDVETLTDFGDIESGRVVEHVLYLGAVTLFALHAFVLFRLVRAAHPAAALFGLVTSTFGYVIMAASSMLHVSTAPLWDLYDAKDTPPEDLPAIEYAWHGAQSVFDTMLTTGVLLVAVGITLFGVALSKAPAFGTRLSAVALGLGIVGTVGVAIAIVDPSTDLSAVGVLAIAVFNLVVGWRTLGISRDDVVVGGSG